MAFPHFAEPEHYQTAPEPPAAVENSGIGKEGSTVVGPRTDAARAADALEDIAESLAVLAGLGPKAEHGSRRP